MSGYTLGTRSFDVTVPADALEGLPPEAPVGEVGVVFAACAGTLLPAPTQTSPVSCVDAQGGAVGRQGFLWGGKRIVVVPGVRNQNPAIVRVRLDGVIWSESYVPVIDGCPRATLDDCPDALQHVFTVEVTPESRETYGDQTEDLVAWFFVSQGEVQDDYLRPGDDFAAATAFAPTAADPSRPVEVWFVVRDDRGGVDFTHRSMRLR